MPEEFSGLIPPRPNYKKEKRTVGYLVLAVFLLLFAARFCRDRLYLFADTRTTVLLFEGITFLLPIAVYLGFVKKNRKVALRLLAPAEYFFPVLLSAFFLLLSGVFLFSVLFDGTGTLGNVFVSFEITRKEGTAGLISDLFILVFLPTLLEEILFRGVLISEYERRGSVRAVLFSSLLFALIHFDPRNLLAYLFLGGVLALTYYAVNSIYAVTALHLLYNLVSFFGHRYLAALFQFTGSVELLLFFLILIFIISLFFFCRAARRIYRAKSAAGFADPYRDVPYAVQFYTVLDALCDPCILISIALSVAGCILFQ